MKTSKRCFSAGIALDQRNTASRAFAQTNLRGQRQGENARRLTRSVHAGVFAPKTSSARMQ